MLKHNLRTCWDFIIALPGRLLIGAARLYQVTFGHLLGGRCRFQPTCSQYFIEAVRKYGTLRGAARGLWRICRCNPWNRGGHDPP
ncbi:MAG: membrane protein insertion efficiency factor YidD [Pirellulales bacterium]|nr:membrane protein insertion efficiency factor YidD [Pirellulales bacterium]